MAEQDGGGWRPAETGEQLWIAGRVRLTGRPTQVRLSGEFLPLTPLLEAAASEIENELATHGPTLGGVHGSARLTGATVTLAGISGRLDHTRGPFYLVLPSGGGAYHAVGSAAIPDGDVLRVTVDPHSLRHLDGRARP